MAAAVATPPKNSKMAKQIRTQLVPLQEVSLAIDSGWRDVDEGHVATLKAMITRGDWGSTTLAGPSLIAEGGTIIFSKEDAKFVIFNGLQIVFAPPQDRNRWQEHRRMRDTAAVGRYHRSDLPAWLAIHCV